MSRAHIDIVFDGPPSHESGRFVEVHDAEDRGIRVGQWVEHSDGLWALRLTAKDFEDDAAVHEGSAYAIAVATRADLIARIDEHEKEVSRQKAQLLATLAEQERLIGVAESGVSIEQFQIARTLVEINWGGREYDPRTRDRTGSRRNSSDVQACFDAAIEEFRAGPKYLIGGYYGVKEYGQWTSQRNDSAYGYGPRHGYIWFSIGIPSQARTELRQGGMLTDEEKIAAIGWLQAVRANPSLLDAGTGQVKA